MGEAASRISTQTKARSPDIPWSAIIGTRSRLIHAYAEIDLDVVWSAAEFDLPRIVRLVEKLLESGA